MPHKKHKILKKKKKRITSPSSSQLKNENKSKITQKKLSTEKPLYDESGVKRIFSPFNRIRSQSPALQSPNRKILSRMPYPSRHACYGLSPKEKSYVICSCQNRTKRYSTLKSLAHNAIKTGKIFTVFGVCIPIRKALVDRGWVEKIPAKRMNLSKIRNGQISSETQIHGELERLLLSNLVEKHAATFVWYTNNELRDTTIDMANEGNIIVNKLKADALWTSKQGLCTSIKENCWYFIENVAEVISPRTYNSYDGGEIEDFTKDFKITACTSLLKWILSMIANDRPVFSDTGSVSINVFVFALNRCKDYLLRKQHRDIDQNLTTVSPGQWNTFLKRYYDIMRKQSLFQTGTYEKLHLYLGYAKYLLKEIHKYRPQLSCEGCHDIWIIKPAHCSRGRGIRMASQLHVITSFIKKADNKYVLQKYIEDPLLIHGTKFDIRQYYIVTSISPLVIWMYKECYLKFSSQKYTLDSFHESIHLTNNAVQKKYQNCDDRHPELPQNNMWDLETYKKYLDKVGKPKVWENIIYPGMKKAIIGIMLSCQDSLYATKNRFELYGCDFILDKEYRPWLIEINSQPDLNSTTSVTGKICPAVLSDIIKVVIDYPENPNVSTGNFECIYRQPVTFPRFSYNVDLSIKGVSLPNDYFYRGKVELHEDDVNEYFNNFNGTEHDDVMIEPEDDKDTALDINEDSESCSHNTKSENELNLVASVITDQIRELINRIPSKSDIFSDPGKSFMTASMNKSVQESSETGFRIKNIKETASVTDVERLNMFDFSKLEDVNSNSHMHRNRFFFNQTDSRDFVQKCFDDTSRKHHNVDDRVSNITTRIISFIKAKEEEYILDVYNTKSSLLD